MQAHVNRAVREWNNEMHHEQYSNLRVAFEAIFVDQ
jgi:hypothetical protein